MPEKDCGPLDVVKFTSAYAAFILSSKIPSNTIVVGRDARISGEMVNKLVVGTLLGMGMDVVDIGLATTPTTELAVTMERAAGGIAYSQHNPKQWNSPETAERKGEFLNAKEGETILKLAETEILHLPKWTIDRKTDRK